MSSEEAKPTAPSSAQEATPPSLSPTQEGGFIVHRVDVSLSAERKEARPAWSGLQGPAPRHLRVALVAFYLAGAVALFTALFQWTIIETLANAHPLRSAFAVVAVLMSVFYGFSAHAIHKYPRDWAQHIKGRVGHRAAEPSSRVLVELPWFPRWVGLRVGCASAHLG